MIITRPQLQHPSRSISLLLSMVCALSLAVGLSSASAAVPTISKPVYITKADAICTAGSAKLSAAADKLGAKPTTKQVKAFLLAVYVPNVAGQIAKIRKLGYPTADKAELTALYKEADGVLASIKKNPTAAVESSTSPFADVATKQRAYGFTSCGAGPSSSSS